MRFHFVCDAAFTVCAYISCSRSVYTRFVLVTEKCFSLALAFYLMKIRTVAYKLAVFRVISFNLTEKKDIIIIITWNIQTSPFTLTLFSTIKHWKKREEIWETEKNHLHFETDFIYFPWIYVCVFRYWIFNYVCRGFFLFTWTFVCLKIYSTDPLLFVEMMRIFFSSVGSNQCRQTESVGRSCKLLYINLFSWLFSFFFGSVICVYAWWMIVKLCNRVINRSEC